jgi:hypothetical protein
MTYQTKDDLAFNQSIFNKQKELIVKRKNVYGNELIYPVCNKAKIFTIIAGNKTLLPGVITQIKALGYTIKTEGETI